MRGFEGLADELLQFVDAFDAIKGERAFAEGSQVDAECSGEVLAGDWGERPTRDAWLSATMRITSGLDHLRALASVLTTPGVVYAKSTVARAAVEAFAMAHYIGDPRIDSRERVRRHVNEVLASLHEEARMIQSAAESSVETMTDALDANQRRFGRTLTTAKTHGFKIRGQGDSYRAPYLGDRPPSTTALCERVVAEGTDKLGRVFYQMLSSVAHSREHGLVSYLQVVESLPDVKHGDSRAALSITSRDAALRLLAAPMAAVSVLQAQALPRGWDLPRIRPRILGLLSAWGDEAGIPYTGPETTA